jgi:uncharacterized protein YjiS (DUF1127 family)
MEPAHISPGIDLRQPPPNAGALPGKKKMSVTNIDLNRLGWVRHSRTAYLSSLLRAIGQSLLWPVRVYQARQALHQLASMDARELRDIGLTPYDVQSAKALPLDVDPSALLASRAKERARSEIEARYY